MGKDNMDDAGLTDDNNSLDPEKEVYAEAAQPAGEYAEKENEEAYDTVERGAGPEYDEDMIFFKNNFEYTESNLKELYRNVIKWDKLRKANLIFLYIVLGVSIAADIAFMIMGQTNLFTLFIVSSILLAALAIFRTVEPSLLAKNTLKGYKKRVNATMACETTFSDDEFTMMDVATNQGKHYTYDLITRVRETETFVVLGIGKREIIPVCKSGFTKGDLADFRPFILDRVDIVESD